MGNHQRAERDGQLNFSNSCANSSANSSASSISISNTVSITKLRFECDHGSSISISVTVSTFNSVCREEPDCGRKHRDRSPGQPTLAISSSKNGQSVMLVITKCKM